MRETRIKLYNVYNVARRRVLHGRESPLRQRLSMLQQLIYFDTSKFHKAGSRPFIGQNFEHGNSIAGHAFASFITSIENRTTEIRARNCVYIWDVIYSSLAWSNTKLTKRPIFGGRILQVSRDEC